MQSYCEPHLGGMKRLFDKLLNTDAWHFLWIAVLLSEIFTALLSSMISLALWGRLDGDIILVGAINAFVVSLIVSAGIIYFLEHASALKEANMRLQHEMSEHRQIEELLKKAANEWKATFDSIGDAVAIVDAEGTFLRCNEAMSRLLGLPFGEINGRTSRELLYERADVTEECPLSRMRKSLRSEELVMKFCDRVIHIRVYPIKNDDEALIGAVYVISDITERKRAEEEMQSTRQLLEKTITSLNEAVFIIDARTRTIIDCNRTAELMFGYEREEIIGRNTEFVHVSSAMYEEFGRNMFAALDEHGLYQTEFRMERKDGSVFSTEHSVTEIRDEEGKRTAVVSVVRDITGRKRAEERLKRSFRRVRELTAHLQSVREEERANIARAIHDDLGQTFTALKMDLSWLKKRLDRKSPEAEKADEAIRLVDDGIEAVKRISSELRPLMLDHLGLKEAMQWQASEFERRSGIRVDCHFDPEDIRVGKKVATELYRISLEALTNVARHSGAKKVKIDLMAEDKDLVLEISDNGRGIRQRRSEDFESFGIIGMRERARSIGGRLDILGIKGEGMKIAVHVPVKARKMR